LIISSFPFPFHRPQKHRASILYESRDSFFEVVVVFFGKEWLQGCT